MNVISQVIDPLWLLVGGIIVVAILLSAIWSLLRRRRRPRRPAAPELALDVSTLESVGPPKEGAKLEIYGTTVRLSVIVVAPGGRGGELPPPDVLPGLMERLVPGMTDVIANHKPMILRWPTQLSSQGFTQAFFNQVALPGARGKGTAWCSLAGKLTIGEKTFLLGLVLCADTINSLSQVTVQHEGQWLDILRIRNE